MKGALKRLGSGENVYGNVSYEGKLLKNWQKELHFQYSLGELYRMASDGEDFNKILRP